MKGPLKIVLPAVVLTMLSGCASSDFMAQRGRDAADIFTLTIGAGSGLKVRVGPIQPAIFQTADMAGLRAGQWLSNGNMLTDNNDASSLLPIIQKPRYSDPVVEHVFSRGRHKVSDYRTEKVIPHSRPQPTFWDSAFGHEIFSHGPGSMSRRRGKDIHAVSPYPFYTRGEPASYYTQIEVAGGLGLAIRLGFNPGELVDFIVGFSGGDLFGDDANPPPPGPPRPR